MPGEFGRFVDRKRRRPELGGNDVMLKDIAAAMGISASYLSDIMKGRRSLPDRKGLEVVAGILRLTDQEKEEMLDIVGREREEAAPDLPEYLMSEELPHVRMALRRAKDKRLTDDFWKRVVDQVEREQG